MAGVSLVLLKKRRGRDCHMSLRNAFWPARSAKQSGILDRRSRCHSACESDFATVAHKMLELDPKALHQQKEKENRKWLAIQVS